MALTWDNFAATWDSPATWDGAAPITGTGVVLGGGVATVLVQIAFGADLTASPSTWTWTDVTTDVMYSAQVNITQGRADETSQAQPATCSFTLFNTAGNYTPYSPNSIYYPGVRRNTPVRVSLDPGTGFVVVFAGYTVGFTPAWDITGSLPTISVSAAGILRRLTQGKTPLRSAMTRAIGAASPAPLAWWPLEDGNSADQGASGLIGGTPITVIGNVGFGADNAPGTGPLADLSQGGQLTARIPGITGSYRIEFVCKFPSFASGDFVAIMDWYTPGGGIDFWEIDATDLVDGGLYVQWASGGTFGGPYLSNVQVDDGEWHHIRIDMSSSGGNHKIVVTLDGVAVITQTTAQAFSPMTRLAVNPLGDPNSEIPTFGQLVVWAPWSGTINTYAAFTGYAGETADARLSRLGAEENVSIAITGSSATAMGAQSVAAFVDLLRECEAADGGVLYDGFDFALGYICRSSRYNLAAAVSLDVSNAEVDDPFAPVDDDQRNRNDVTVNRTNGSSGRFIDVTGVLGTNAIGTYDSSVTVNTQTDNVLTNIAAWNVHLGTVLGLRYPNVAIDLIATPGKVASWLAATPISFRLDILNVVTKATQAPPGTVSLIVEGYTQQIDNFTWQVACNCSPFAPWRVFVVADPVLGRIDTGGSAMNSSHGAGTTSLGVKTNTGPLWTTTATNPGDFPFDIGCNGEQMTVTAIVGVSSPQTFTVTRAVNGISKATNTNDVVALWNPTAIAL